jgi:hypothetical protein
MSHKHAHLMRSIFQDPPSANIHWREIESLLHHLGADIEPSHGARFKITLNKVEAFLHHPHNSSTSNHVFNIISMAWAIYVSIMTFFSFSFPL